MDTEDLTLALIETRDRLRDLTFIVAAILKSPASLDLIPTDLLQPVDEAVVRLRTFAEKRP